MITDNPREACGIFGIYSPGEDVARVSFFGLYALQHRGQESAGIATSDGQELRVRTGMGLVAQVFVEEDLADLKGGYIAIGHTRYSTTGSSRIANAQPLVVDGDLGKLALAQNGNIVNASSLRAQLEPAFSFSSSTDAEVIARLITSSFGRTWEEKILRTMPRLQGAFSLALLTKDSLIGVRDPMGIRPLCLGKLNGGWVLASESCALDTVGAQYVREVEPGEIVVVDRWGVHSTLGAVSEKRSLCVFEFIYFARPDSLINGRLLYLARQEMGVQLAREYPVDADLVIAVPDSAIPAGIGYAKESGIPYSEGLIKNRYIGRTFIQPDQRMREMGVQIKFNPLLEALSGKRLVVLDDSIVRGTTTPRVVSLLRKAGASEVHMRICAPPIRYPCFFGVDMATRAELIASRKSVQEIATYIGADSLGYLSVEGLVKAVGLPGGDFCLACFTGAYPLPVQLEMDKLVLERQ
ncbi:MAG: amidophosphoribosyltransferase [Dehalococcoidia bacterium]|nr:amidophosphoribosyltransferase [Dehalococcoidia bacterium]